MDIAAPYNRWYLRKRVCRLLQHVFSLIQCSLRIINDDLLAKALSVSLSSSKSCEYIWCKYWTLLVLSGVRHKSECHLGIFISVLEVLDKT